MKTVQQKRRHKPGYTQAIHANHQLTKETMEITKARRPRHLPKETLMLNWGYHETAKRCTKY
jgi:hypothetical protein